MNLRKIFTQFFIFFNYIVFSQKGLVFYTQSGELNGTKSRISTLIFNKSQSSYVTEKDSLDGLLIIDENSESSAPKRLKYQDGGVMISEFLRSKNGSQVLTDIEKDSVYSSFKIKKSKYLVKESLLKIKWFVLNETKKIGNLICKKATCSFRGRNFIVWYTPEIPVPFGPWKLQGLPGLILEAYDDMEMIFYNFKSVEYPTQNKTPIARIIRLSADKKVIYPWLTVKQSLEKKDESLQEDFEFFVINMPNLQNKKGNIKQMSVEITE